MNRIDRVSELNSTELSQLIGSFTDEEMDYAAKKAREVARESFGNRIYIRGLIEFTNICQNNCYYCGLRAANANVARYRLTPVEILTCCERGYALGTRTFVLQGGEDPYYTDEMVCSIVSEIKTRFPDCAITLSIGEKPRDSYEKFFAAGAERYLLRHETADRCHYEMLHPAAMSFDNRRRCLKDLKEIGFQTGCGFMVGSPWQSPETIAEDFAFMRGLNPQMIGIGPFIPQQDTPFSAYAAGSVRLTLFLLSLLRILFPKALIPATTALSTLMNNSGILEGILHGANVFMPNLTPPDVRANYKIYDNKAADDAANLEKMRNILADSGYEIAVDRGDYA